MAQADDLRASIKVCMFDQYGTVVDMQTGLTEAAAPFLAAKGWQGDPNSFVTWWRRTHFENSMIDALLHREHTSYREIGHRSVAFVLERSGIPYTLDEVRDLVAHIERLRPFSEVPEALARLQTRYPLVVLSNGDPDMLAFWVARLPHRGAGGPEGPFPARRLSGREGSKAEIQNTARLRSSDYKWSCAGRRPVSGCDGALVLRAWPDRSGDPPKVDLLHCRL